MGIGKVLSELIAEKNTNPNDLAKKSGVPPMTIYSMIKRDNTKADITSLARICKALDVPMERFYEDYIAEQEHNSNLAFSDREKQVVKKYRDLDETGRQFIDIVLEHELKRCTHQNPQHDSKEDLILSVVAARSKDNKTPIQTKYVKDLSEYPPDDTDL